MSNQLRFLVGLTLLVSALTPSTVAAQRDSLSLGQILREAGGSPRLRAARADADAASARTGLVARLPDPQVQLSWMNYGVPGFRPMTPLTMRQLQVMQMLPVAGRLAASRDAAASGRAEGEARALVAVSAVRRSLVEHFVELRRLDQALSLAHESLQVAQDLQATTLAMLRSGEGRQADVLRAEVEVARMRAEVERILAMRRARAAQLNAELDRSADHRVPVTMAMLLPAVLPDIAALIGIAERGRPELRRANATVERSDAEARVARSEIWPDLLVGVQVAEGRDLMGAPETMASLMLGASVPIYARSRQRAMRLEGEAMLAMARADRAMLGAETRGEIGMAHADLTQARTIAAMYRQSVLPAAQQAYASALAAYRAGSLPFMAVLDAQMTLVREREELLRLEAEEGLAWAALEALTGQHFLDAVSPLEQGDRND